LKPYHIGFSKEDLGYNPPQMVLLSGEPERSSYIANNYLNDPRLLSDYRGLNSYVGYLDNNKPILIATSGIGASSTSIVVNELVQIGITQIIRIGTSGSIQSHVNLGSIVITRAALCRQGAANDIAPQEYPAAADPFLTVALVQAAQQLNIECHLGLTASVDTFYEGQERIASSANPHLLAKLHGITKEYRNLNILNYEMESGILFKMAGVYGFSAACVCGIIAQRLDAEEIILDSKNSAVQNAIEVALLTAKNFSSST